VLYRSEQIRDDHVLDSFSCGNDYLDSWLRRSAMECGRKNVARTYVWADDDKVVWAYFSLAPDKVQRADLPRAIGRGDPDEIPAVLIGKLALRDVLQGQGLGRQLLVDALTRAVSAVEIVSGRYIVVDAIDEDAVAFYRRYGFTPLPAPSASRLIMKSSDASASLAAAPPAPGDQGPKRGP
jgi:GNAT superfamily N-acetyltransferase